MGYSAMESLNAFKIRWFIENCCEIKLPSGKTIVIDPMLSDKNDDSVDHWHQQFYSGFGPDTLEGCDCVILSHVHGDHIASLREVYDKWHGPIVVNHASALALALHEDIAPGAFIPAAEGTTLNFGDFKVTPLAGRHTNRVSAAKPSQSKLFGDNEKEREFGILGSLYNNNYILELGDNFRIALDSGYYEADLSEWEKYHPNLVLRHAERDPQYEIEMFKDILDRTGASYALVLCNQMFEPEEREARNRSINAALAEAGINGRVINAKPGQWLNFSFGYQAE